MACFLQTKADIDTQMAQIHERVQIVKDIVKGSVRGKENPKGVLTKSEQEYIACLEMQHVRFESLMRQDEAHWAENLEMVKK